MKIHASVAAAALLLSVACRSEAKPPTYTALEASSEALRGQFNKDAGKTRVLMLVAPT